MLQCRTYSVFFFLLSCYLALVTFVVNPASAESTDVRCKCLCTDYKKYNISAKIYSKNVVHEKCNCLNVAIPSIDKNIAKDDLESLCLHCECKYEMRSTNTMKVVVCIYLALISVLILYMVYLQIISPLVSKLAGLDHQRFENESPTEMDSIPTNGNHSNTTRLRSSVFDKMNSVQSKWKRKVKEQRSNVFDRRDILQ